MAARTKERRDLVRAYIKEHPEGTQEEIVAYLEKENAEWKGTSQSTIHRDLIEHLGYRKINGTWQKMKSKSLDEDGKILKNIIYQDQPKIMRYSEKMQLLFVKTNNRKERAIADLISSIYEENILGVFTGDNCLMVVTANKKNAEDIRKFLINSKKSNE